MKSFREFITESREVNPLGHLPRLEEIISVAEKTMKTSGIWTIVRFIKDQLLLSQAEDIVEIGPGHSRFRDMQEIYQRNPLSWGQKPYNNSWFKFFTGGIRYVCEMREHLRSEPITFWLSKEEYAKVFGVTQEVDTLFKDF
jgi:hypothetical protein